MAAPSEKSVTQPWGDSVDGEDYDVQATGEDEPTETVVEIKKNENGQEVKVTRTIKKVLITERVNKRAFQRRQNWKKFGDAMDKTYNQTTSVGDIVQFQYEKVGKTEKKTLEEQIKKEMQETLSKAGKPTVGAWSLRRQQEEAMASASGAPLMRAPGGARIAASPGAYVPPARARGDEMATIRVSNLSDEVQEHELADLFARYGHPRVRLLFDKQTNAFKNIAFVSFGMREEAEAAMKALEGTGLHHLIMNLEWAKPSGSAPFRG